MTELVIGSFARYPMTLLCYVAAGKLCERRGELLSVTLDPEGQVCVEAPENAAEVDIVGTYRAEPEMTRRELEDQIRADLAHELELRKAS